MEHKVNFALEVLICWIDLTRLCLPAHMMEAYYPSLVQSLVLPPEWFEGWTLYDLKYLVIYSEFDVGKLSLPHKKSDRKNKQKSGFPEQFNAESRRTEKTKEMPANEYYHLTSPI